MQKIVEIQNIPYFLPVVYVKVSRCHILHTTTVYPKKYAHGFVVHCFVVVMQSFIMNSHEEFIHIHQGCFTGTGAIVRLPQCQWSKPDGYGKISAYFLGYTVHQYTSMLVPFSNMEDRNDDARRSWSHDSQSAKRVCYVINVVIRKHLSSSSANVLCSMV